MKIQTKQLILQEALISRLDRTDIKLKLQRIFKKKNFKSYTEIDIGHFIRDLKFMY